MTDDVELGVGEHGLLAAGLVTHDERAGLQLGNLFRITVDGAEPFDHHIGADLGGNATAALVMPLMSFHTQTPTPERRGATTLLDETLYTRTGTQSGPALTDQSAKKPGAAANVREAAVPVATMVLSSPGCGR